MVLPRRTAWCYRGENLVLWRQGVGAIATNKERAASSEGSVLLAFCEPMQERNTFLDTFKIHTGEWINLPLPLVTRKARQVEALRYH